MKVINFFENIYYYLQWLYLEKMPEDFKIKYFFGNILYHLLFPYWLYMAKFHWKKDSLFILAQYRMILANKY